MTSFNIRELLETKAAGRRLESDQIAFLVASFTRDASLAPQAAAFLTHAFHRGLDWQETSDLTGAMTASGDTLDLSSIAMPKIDKHSSGGIGDKISIPLAPLVACCGIVIPMISGRGLGKTGGTLDKLEAIPGFRTNLKESEFLDVIQQVGFCMVGQTERLVPADRLFYSLRDACGAVPSIPLIVASIMSKKLAEDLDGLVLDVKFGSGAFMPDFKKAEELARAMVEVGKIRGKRMAALVTDMDQPLGRCVGNATEIVESVQILRGRGPRDVRELTLELGAHMLVLGDRALSLDKARAILVAKLDSGEAYERFCKFVELQGGDPSRIENEGSLLNAAHIHTLRAERSGYLTHVDAAKIGVGCHRLGAGRSTQAETIDPAVGITDLAQAGQKIQEGDSLASVHYNDAARLEDAFAAFDGAFRIEESAAPERRLVQLVIN